MFHLKHVPSYAHTRVARFYKPKWEKYTKMATRMTNDKKIPKVIPNFHEIIKNFNSKAFQSIP
jgi:hypothetical protein